MKTPENFVARVGVADSDGKVVEQRTYIFPATATLADVHAKVFSGWISSGEFHVTEAEAGMPNPTVLDRSTIGGNKT